MKKVILLLTVFTTFITTSDSIYAQEFNDSEAVAFVDFEEFEKRNTKYELKSNLIISEKEIVAKAEAYDKYVSKDFGSYLNPYNGTLNIVNNKNTPFTKAQFLKKNSDVNIFSMKIDAEIMSINISQYNSGDYILILSNNKGDILVEDFIII